MARLVPLQRSNRGSERIGLGRRLNTALGVPIVSTASAEGQAALARYRNLFSPDAANPLMLETYARLAAEQEDSRDNQSCHPWGRCRQKSTIELMPRGEFLTLA